MNTEDFLNHEINRRKFLESSARNAAGMAVGMVGTGVAVSAGLKNSAPLERLSLGIVGIRNRGKKLAACFAKLPDVTVKSICDIDRRLFPAVLKKIAEHQKSQPKVEADFLKVLFDPGIDAVVIATPDHWHQGLTNLACEAGKDIYVETPVSHSLQGVESMIAAAEKHGRIVQVGLQQRSCSHFQSAIDFVRSGKLGNVYQAKAWYTDRRKQVPPSKSNLLPEDVDYDRWLGPAPARDFDENRFHYNWRWYWDYGSGALGNWGVHMLDVARWGLNLDWPKKISASGGNYRFKNQETPDTLTVNYEYENRSIVWEHRLWSPHGIEGRSTGVAFYGEKATLVVDRGGWKVYDTSENLTAEPSDGLMPHLRNFVDAVKSRQQPVADLATAHISSGLCHLGNVSYRLGRELRFDTSEQRVVGDDQANEMLDGKLGTGGTP